MALPRQKFREIVFQLLYGQEFGEIESRESMDLVMRQLKVTRSSVKKGLEKVQEILKHIESLDKEIAYASKDYPLERISKVERTILQMCLYEMLYEETPSKVAITEAVRLSRKFGSPEGATFVNGILDHIYKKHGD